jgi:hypothetical protein
VAAADLPRTELKNAEFGIFIGGLSVLSIVNVVLLRRRRLAAQPGAPAYER